MTELEKTKVCPKCGGTMDLRNRKDGSGSFYVCRDKECKTYENVKPYKATTKKSTLSSLSIETSDIVTEIKKTYDEVVAQFANDYPEVVGDPATLQALASTVYIEKNKRLRKEKF